MKKREITANTFTPLYDELEDRVRLVVNYQSLDQRIDFMITRNFMIQLIPTLEEYLEKYYVHLLTKEDVLPVETQQSSSTHETSSMEENFSQTDSTDLELYRTQEELLITINLSYLKQTEETVLHLLSASSSGTIQVNGSILEAFIKTLKSSIPYSRWGISPYF